ncbi:Phloem protein 2-like [Vigna unguiculata]|uniref:Phloem protein 2-like n=1 Tax=Vigna unguiculata TaxID=3917 RepID=A0A4D6L300_VIGUN|nr:Phloem protein 2-like [Vigna unguiculata]
MGATQSQEQPQSQTRFQLQSQHHQQQQPPRHEAATRESWSLSPEGNTKSSKNSTKMVNNATKLNETQSSMPVKAWNFEGQIPHNYEHILKDADSPLANSSNWGNLLDQLYAGKYWVEKKSNSNCFVLYARALSITWAENQNYWKWEQQKVENGTMIELAKLKMVCWLEVHGKFDIGMVSPGILYQVSFIVMVKDSAEGWELPVNVRVVLPGGRKQQHRENLMEKPRERWIEVPAGDFVASQKDVGEMEISMYEYDGGMWKTGLVIQGVAIKPKN